jgi:hypothetical protein
VDDVMCRLSCTPLLSGPSVFVVIGTQAPTEHFSLDREMCETGPAKTIHVLKNVVVSDVMSRAFIATKWLSKQDIQQK